MCYLWENRDADPVTVALSLVAHSARLILTSLLSMILSAEKDPKTFKR